METKDYNAEIATWNWDAIVENAKENLYPASEQIGNDETDEGYIGCEFQKKGWALIEVQIGPALFLFLR